MTSISSYNTDPFMENISDRSMCSFVRDLSRKHQEENDHFARLWFRPNELMANMYASHDMLYFDNDRAMRKGLCEKSIVQGHGGNSTGKPSATNEKFLVHPCANKKQKFVNYIDCNKDQCCTIRHELFGNLTKRT